MKWLIQDNEMVGYVNPASFPGRKLVDGPELPRELLYYDPVSETVKEKPEKPGSTFVWNQVTLSWQDVQPVDLEPAPTDPFKIIETRLRDSIFFARAYEAAGLDQRCNRDFSFVQTAIAITRNEQDLRFGLSQLRTHIRVLAETGQIEDFTAAEIESLKEILNEAGFDPETFAL